MAYKDFEKSWAKTIARTPVWVLLVFHPIMLVAYLLVGFFWWMGVWSK